MVGHRGPSLAIAVVTAGLLGPAALGQEGDDLPDFTDLDLEQLMEVRVTSVTGREQPLLDTPAAITVITAEDIRRTGHLSIAEALRLVPGFFVGRISPSIWAVGSRGFGDRFTNDLLVLVDGRTVYDPLFSGVFWHAQDVVLEDIDRIEVIRGPGATLWGANAVNGVVNITTKTAHETQGLLITGVAGTDQQSGTLRYGGRIDEDTSYRVWTKYRNHEDFDAVGGGSVPSSWDMWRGGFRIDRHGADDVELMLEGDVYATGHIDDLVRVPVPGPPGTFVNQRLDQHWNGGHLLFRAGRDDGGTRGWSVQAYYDRTRTRGGQPDWEVRRDTVDVDYRQYVPHGADDEHVLMWGLGYQHTDDRTARSTTLSFDPRSRTMDTFSGFVQDTIALRPDELTLMIGSKFDHNDHTGFEVQPSARLSWQPNPDRTFWGAVSRAVRRPSRIADDVRLTTTYAGATPLMLVGDPDLDSEELVAYELGWRERIGERLTLDVAGFHNDYDEVITLPLPAGTIGNRGAAQTWGAEIAATWRIAENWRLRGSYSVITIDVDSPDGTAEQDETPPQQFQVRSELDLTPDLGLDGALYWTDAVPDVGADDHFRLDLGITWRPAPNVELAIWGRNLLDGRHLEFTDDFFLAMPLEVERSVYARLTVRF